ncbi:MAG TPA: competence/damage-inducible protein A [Vicinamibacterales bacterium]
MKAWIVAVGSELLTPFRVDTNSLAITERLNAIGIDVRLKFVVGDDVDELASIFERGIGHIDVIVCTGGLGPTEDDITRDALTRALKVPVDVDEAIVERIRQRFERRGLTMPENNRRQGVVPRGATVVENPRGTAPGLWIDREGTSIAILPGPPREMTPMLEALIAERLQPRTAGAGLFRRVLKLTGRTESDVDQRAHQVYGRWLFAPIPIATTILAVMGSIELHLTASAASRAEAEAALDSAVQELRDLLGTTIYSVDGRQLEAVIGDLLREKRLTLAVAESCSGGLLASRITDVPGSSEYFDRGVVCYSNRAKEEMLGVPAPLIAAHGAVSEPVASAMAGGIAERSGSDIGIGITGIAGPGGGTPEKPVGTVAIAVKTPSATQIRTFQFLGGRDMVKFQSAQAAMNMLRLMLLSDG